MSQSRAGLLIAHRSQLIAHKDAPGFLDRGLHGNAKRTICDRENLLMTRVMLVAIDLARHAVLLMVHLLALLCG